MVTPKNLGGGTLGTTTSTLYTAPAGGRGIVKEIIICNKSGTAANVTLLFDGKTIVGGKSIANNDTIVLPMTAVVEAGKTVTGSAGTASAIDIYISGVEVV